MTLAENALAPFSASRTGALTYRTVLSTPNPSAHSIDVDPKGDRVLVAPSFAVQGDLTVLVNWESMLAK